jgi:hypothetical protein
LGKLCTIRGSLIPGLAPRACAALDSSERTQIRQNAKARSLARRRLADLRELDDAHAAFLSGPRNSASRSSRRRFVLRSTSPSSQRYTSTGRRSPGPRGHLGVLAGSFRPCALLSARRCACRRQYDFCSHAGLPHRCAVERRFGATVRRRPRTDAAADLKGGSGSDWSGSPRADPLVSPSNSTTRERGV